MKIRTFWRLVVVVATKHSPKQVLFDRVVSHFQEKVSSTGVLNGEHMMCEVVVGLDKATILMHCYLAVSLTPAMPQSR